MSLDGDALHAAAEHMGVLPRWRAIDGSERETSAETKRALLDAMGWDGDGPEPAAPSETVVLAGAPARVPAPDGLAFTLLGDDGAAVLAEGRVADGAADLPGLPSGVHRLIIGGGASEVLVIAAPRHPPAAPEIAGRSRLWGVLAALYGQRSARGIGVGDFSDLGALAARLGALGADFVGINPVCAPGADGEISPYSPTHRGFLNPAHIAIDAISGFATNPVVQRLMADAAPKIASARAAGLVDYETASAVRAPVLEALFAEGGGDPAFALWRAGAGAALEDFAIFEAIAETHGPSWRFWPAPLRDRASPETAAFAARAAERVTFHAWSQWIAGGQLAGAQARAKAGGMALGLYLDLAVGARPDGAEVWCAPEAYAAGVSIGSPPDAFAPDGQTWGLAPFSPPGLRRAAYGPFRDVLRATMAHAGLVRIDHALGLNRCFWAPESGVEGGYVRYPLDVMLAIVAIEAEAAGAAVIGEDLGVTPSGFRERLAEAGLYGCAVTQFERDHGGVFHAPRDYRQLSLASFATHDTPTIRGWLHGRDLDWRARLGQLPDEGGSREDRARSREGLEWMLGREGDLHRPEGGGLAEDDAVVDAAHRALARSGAEMAAIQLDDALGEVEQQNLPGTIDEHPNWRRRAPVALEALADAPGLRRAAAIMNEERRPGHGPAHEEEK